MSPTSKNGSEGLSNANGKVDIQSKSSPPNLGFVIIPKVEGQWTVKKALEASPRAATSADPNSPLLYFHLIKRLKTTKRKGWRHFNIKREELITNYMYYMFLLLILTLPALAP
ncbi:hypothetical protein ColLi_11599 [Colletotrichum liriopes]|uniref:Uncharacterized protein n=1 Tax=Colletotrichum liriopes TaxID=708192 RepID=A0AA37GYJ9_9PEZI|nr:hypothetical protein ColLi_11599 [Colletotrichum liriopes]